MVLWVICLKVKRIRVVHGQQWRYSFWSYHSWTLNSLQLSQCSCLLSLSLTSPVCHLATQSWNAVEKLGTAGDWSSIFHGQDASVCLLQAEVLILKFLPIDGHATLQHVKLSSWNKNLGIILERSDPFFLVFKAQKFPVVFGELSPNSSMKMWPKGLLSATMSTIMVKLTMATANINRGEWCLQSQRFHFRKNREERWYEYSSVLHQLLTLIQCLWAILFIIWYLFSVEMYGGNTLNLFHSLPFHCITKIVWLCM